MNRILKDIIKDYHEIIKFLIVNKLLKDNKEFSITNNGRNSCTITWDNKNNQISNILYDEQKNIDELMLELSRNNQYNILLNDGSIFQVEYIIVDGVIKKQRMIFIKKNNLINEQAYNDSEYDFEEINSSYIYSGVEELTESTMHDVNDNYKSKGIPIMLRIDYDPESFVECIHPKSHLTMCNLKNCRIPIKANMSFLKFAKFIINNVYGIECDIAENLINESCLCDNEKKLTHINWE